MDRRGIDSGSIFLSYAREDAVAARRIADALAASGLQVWFDQSALRGGEVWDADIRRQIRECALFIPIISARSNQRTEGYFRREWKLAVERMQNMADGVPFLLPVVIDETVESQAIAPDAFREVHWARLPGGESSLELIERVHQLLTVGHQPRMAASRIEHSTLLRRIGRAPAIAAAILVIGLSAVILTQLSDRREVSGAWQLASAATPLTIAVLPFSDLSSARDQEYFSDGISDEILTALARVEGLRVTSRTSAFSFKGKNATIQEIGRELKVGAVLDGSVRREGNRVRISAHLVNTVDGFERWTQTYDRELTGTFTLQEDVAAAVATALQVKVLPQNSSSQNDHRTTSGEAYDTYVQGRYLLSEATAESRDKALKQFQRVLQLDPEFALGYAALAYTYSEMADAAQIAPTEGYAKARAAAEKALALDNRLAEAHGALAWIKMMNDWDFAAAANSFETALALGSSEISTLLRAARLSLRLGRSDEAMARVQQAIAIDPLSVRGPYNLAITYLYVGRYAESEATARKVLEAAPSYANTRSLLGNAQLMQSRYADAIASHELEKVPGLRVAGLALAHTMAGHPREAKRWLDELIQRYGDDGAFQIAEIYAQRNEHDEAFRWLDRAFRLRDSGLTDVAISPFLAPLHADARWSPFLAKMGLLRS